MKTIKSAGFTLIETLIALAIFSVLTATLVVISKSSTDRITQLETTAIARIALDNIVMDFKNANATPYIGRYEGEYSMSYFDFRWEIKVERSQQVGKNLLIGRIFLSQDKSRNAQRNDDDDNNSLTQVTQLL